MINSILIPHFPPPLQYLSGLVFQRHLLHARPWVCLCVCVRVCACLFVCIRACVHTREETAESNCTGPSADCGKQACILQTQTAQTKKYTSTDKHTPTGQHTHTHRHTPQVPASKPSTWTSDNLHPFSGSCVDGIDWHGLQYGLYCFRTKASPLKAKVTL